jgi:hypothetical protein
MVSWHPPHVSGDMKRDNSQCRVFEHDTNVNDTATKRIDDTVPDFTIYCPHESCLLNATYISKSRIASIMLRRMTRSYVRWPVIRNTKYAIQIISHEMLVNPEVAFNNFLCFLTPGSLLRGHAVNTKIAAFKKV